MIDIDNIGDLFCVKMSGTQLSNKYQCINMLYNMKGYILIEIHFCQLYYLHHIDLYHCVFHHTKFGFSFQGCFAAGLVLIEFNKMLGNINNHFKHHKNCYNAKL